MLVKRAAGQRSRKEASEARNRSRDDSYVEGIVAI
jgi:hypothetical protein